MFLLGLGLEDASPGQNVKGDNMFVAITVEESLLEGIVILALMPSLVADARHSSWRDVVTELAFDRFVYEIISCPFFAPSSSIHSVVR